MERKGIDASVDATLLCTGWPTCLPNTREQVLSPGFIGKVVVIQFDVILLVVFILSSVPFCL